MNETQKDASHRVRQAVVQTLSSVEDLVYVGLGLLLTIAALTLLVTTLKSVALALWNHALGGQVVNLLDQILLILLVIELLYTVQVSFREHGLIAEPFLVVALIAVIRRILVLTAEVPKLAEAGEAAFRHAMVELGVLTVMVLVLVSSLIMLQKYAKRAV
ncbi:MAG: phosphate-starvation-inducible PsiE family protein [Terriglobales bacterium]